MGASVSWDWLPRVGVGVFQWGHTSRATSSFTIYLRCWVQRERGVITHIRGVRLLLTHTTTSPSMSWEHKPRLLIIIWCLWVFPFTLWDTLYLFLRPHSLPGGKWHDRYYSRTFAIWASVDRTYGEQGWRDHDGFVLAQSVVNMVEAFLSIYYVWALWTSGIGGLRVPVSGKSGARAVLTGLCAGCVTLAKTSLYCKFQRCSPRT
jgi:hypothetical protein